MDIFKFHNPNSPTKLEQGEVINGLKTKMWVERYSKEGEVRLSASATSGMRDKLPIGSFISHVNTPEVMVIENHEISEQVGTEPEIVITGRSFETVLEGALPVGGNISFPVAGPPLDYDISADYIPKQIQWLINHHISPIALIDDNNSLPYVAAANFVTPLTGIIVDRQIKVGGLYQAVLDLLKIENYGIKVIRPGPFWNPWAGVIDDDIYVALIIHVGLDKSDKVSFSYDTGEITSADYLWSNKNYKDAALVFGKWVTTEVIPTAVGLDRRWMIIDAHDIDQGYSTAPDTGVVSALMQQRGMEILNSQKNIALTKAEVSRENVKALYRKDFDIGDLITVHGDYNTVSKMRVSEYVEIEDDTGEYGYPTLTID